MKDTRALRRLPEKNLRSRFMVHCLIFLREVSLLSIPALIVFIALFLSNEVRSAEFDAESLPEFDCVIEPSEIVDLGSAVPGVIGAVYVERSDTVKMGDIVAELESSVAKASARLSRKRAELETSIELRKESVAFGHRTRERNQALLQQSNISQQAIDKLETENRIAQLQVHQERDKKNIAGLEYRRAQAILERHSIRTPFDGVVMDRFKSVGEYIEADPVLRVARLDPLNVEVVLPVEYLGRLSSGIRAEVTPVLPGFTGEIATVILVDKVADAASGTFGTRLSLPNPGYAIPSGLRCRLVFLPPEEDLQEQFKADEALIAKDDTLESERDNSIAEEIVEVQVQDEEQTQEQEYEQAQSPFDETLIATADSLEDKSDDSIAEEFDESQALEYGPFDERMPMAIENANTISYTNECYQVGPLGDEVLASSLLNAITDIPGNTNYGADLANRIEIATSYLVLAGNQPGELATPDLEEYLTSNGIQDIFRMERGPHKGRLSIGYYQRKENASNRQHSLRSIGVETEMLEFNREQSAYWINLLFDSNPESQSKLRAVANTLAPRADVQKTQCEENLTAQYQ